MVTSPKHSRRHVEVSRVRSQRGDPATCLHRCGRSGNCRRVTFIPSMGMVYYIYLRYKKRKLIALKKKPGWLGYPGIILKEIYRDYDIICTSRMFFLDGVF